MNLAFDARIGVLHIQTLLAPHIAKESNAQMDRIEATMAQQETQVGKDLDGLAALAEAQLYADLQTAASVLPVTGRQDPDLGAIARKHERPFAHPVVEPEAKRDESLS